MLRRKVIAVGITGGIAAYKVAELVSRLTKKGYEVHVIMTASAQKFITPLTFRTLSGNPVITDMFDPSPLWNVQHVSLAEKADAFVVVPATANIIGKIANGLADDMLSTTVMAAQCPVVLAPAMNVHMWENPVVQSNIKKLEELGYRLIDPGVGRLACGTEGKGRLADIDCIEQAL
ncbi:MAG: bifunctional phosphopantothenoylcysteine decarboxylase/phosphopantothenate--cysteine ligase CoaBC, partial [Desulfitobacteriaceae bacterium]|nr:bifunctional phosphopantothenoylcysteine decarboxylase/phosphopantothenate--cysteine ligase CoaBC [Desulfitobacteriaceae bacterium]